MRIQSLSLDTVFAEREALLREISEIRERRRREFQLDVEGIDREYDRQVERVRNVAAIRDATMAWLVAAFYVTFFAWTAAVACL